MRGTDSAVSTGGLEVVLALTDGLEVVVALRT